jgi:hypothetical protein
MYTVFQSFVRIRFLNQIHIQIKSNIDIENAV